MIKIQDLTIYEYFFSGVNTDQQDSIIEFLKPENKFLGKQFIEKNITFDEMEVLKRSLNNPNLESMSKVIIPLFRVYGDINTREVESFMNESIFQLFRAQKYLQQFVSRRMEIEKRAFEGRLDVKLIRIKAGEKLAPYSHQLSKNQLAKDFGCDPDTIGGWKYNKVFSILASNSALSGVKADYADQK